MKIRIYFLFLIMITALTTYGQRQPKPAEERAANLTEWMKTNLELTTDQVPKVQEINLRYAKMNDDLKESSAATQREKLSKVKNSQTKRDAEMKAVLTDSQYAIYEAKKEEIKKRLKEEAGKRRKNQ